VYFDKDVIIVDEGMEIVVVHDGGQDVFDRDVHVFIAVHGRVEVEILDVDGHETRIGGGDDTVEKDFDGRQISGGGSHFAGIVNTVDNFSGKLSALLPRKLRGLSSLVGMNVEIPHKQDLEATDSRKVCRKLCRKTSSIEEFCEGNNNHSSCASSHP
jgi:hypothetical protein